MKNSLLQWRTQEFLTGGAYATILRPANQNH